MSVISRQWVVDKSVFCVALCAMLFALCSLTEAQEPGKIYRIGFLYAGNPSAVAARIKAFREGGSSNAVTSKVKISSSKLDMARENQSACRLLQANLSVSKSL